MMKWSNSKRQTILFSVIIIVVLFCFLSCTKSEDVYTSVQKTGLKVGQFPPDFEAESLDGQTIKLSDYKGKVVLLDFWATWCPPCVHEMPSVVAAYNKYNSQGFEIIGISLDTNKEKLRNFINDNDVKWIQIFDRGSGDDSIASVYKINAIPTPILLDKEGKIFDKNARGSRLEQGIEELFNR